jgi:hypothetical protein
MSNPTTPNDATTTKTPTATTDELKGIEYHKTAAKHHEEAAKHHLDAAKHHEAGNHEKASSSTVKANGHHTLAHEAQKEDSKYHAKTAS